MSSHEPERKLYPVPETRHRLGGIGHTQFYELVRNGELETVKIGRRTFVASDEIQRFIAGLKARAAA